MATDLDEIDILLQDNIDEYVYDDNKIVTIKWLSLTLNIPINESKKALAKFVNDHKEKKKGIEINTTYFIAGLSSSKDGNHVHKCVVVPDDLLDEVRKSFSVVTSCHIYSVQKAKLKVTTEYQREERILLYPFVLTQWARKDYISLYMTDFDVIRQNVEKSQSQSSITCPWVEQKAKVEYMKSFETPSNLKVSESTSSKPSAASTTSTVKGHSKKPEPKGSIANMFSSAGKKSTVEEKPAVVKVKEEAETGAANKPKSKPEAKKGGVLAMFNDQSNKKEAAKKEEEAMETKGALPKAMETKGALPKAMETKGALPKTNTKSEEKTKVKGGKKRAVDSDTEEPKRKQRRRIKTEYFDSSDEGELAASDPEEANEDKSVVINSQTESEPVLIKSSTESEKGTGPADGQRSKRSAPADKEEHSNNENNSCIGIGVKKRKRTKKVVTKNVLDEEGFMVTQKVTEWLSETDDSDAENDKAEDKKLEVVNTKSSATGKAEPKAKKPAKKTVSPQKGKQTSLMSFFKKS